MAYSDSDFYAKVNPTVFFCLPKYLFAAAHLSLGRNKLFFFLPPVYDHLFPRQLRGLTSKAGSSKFEKRNQF